MDAAVDAVIAWVDGNDPLHRQKRGSYTGGVEIDQDATDNTRFEQSGEIYYCIASILKYAPFIRRIWVVTDNQTPALLSEFSNQNLCRPDFIQIVDHKSLFAGHESALPTFNSVTIETMLCFIPGLADRFIYFNDDFFLNHEQKLGDWFPNGCPKIRSYLRKNSRKKLRTPVRAFMRKITLRPPNTRPRFGRAQEMAANLLGLTDYYWSVHHNPHPIRKNVLLDYYAQNPEILGQQIKHRFRDYRQFLPVSMANHIEILENGAIPVPVEPVAYLKPTKSKLDMSVIEDIKLGESAFACIQSLDGATENMKQDILDVLNEKFESFLPRQLKDPTTKMSVA